MYPRSHPRSVMIDGVAWQPVRTVAGAATEAVTAGAAGAMATSGRPMPGTRLRTESLHRLLDHTHKFFVVNYSLEAERAGCLRRLLLNNLALFHTGECEGPGELDITVADVGRMSAEWKTIAGVRCRGQQYELRACTRFLPPSYDAAGAAICTLVRYGEYPTTKVTAFACTTDAVRLMREVLQMYCTERGIACMVHVGTLDPFPSGPPEAPPTVCNQHRAVDQTVMHVDG